MAPNWVERRFRPTGPVPKTDGSGNLAIPDVESESVGYRAAPQGAQAGITGGWRKNEQAVFEADSARNPLAFGDTGQRPTHRHAQVGQNPFPGG